LHLTILYQKEWGFLMTFKYTYAILSVKLLRKGAHWMIDEKIFLLGNGYPYLESYLTELYGERGKARHNLLRYWNSNEFKAGCRYANSLDAIPELNPKQIKNAIRREEFFKYLTANIQNKYDQLNEQRALTEDDYLEIAGIMGLCPGHTDWVDTLYPHLVDLFVCSKEQEYTILNSINSKKNIVSVMVNVMMDGIRDGQIIDYYGRNVMSQGYARNYFRGENAYNRTTKGSVFRGMPADAVDAEVFHLIGEIKIVEFSLWLNQLDCVRNWQYGDIFHGAIAQHYGISTNGIDVSSNLKVALFFACCKYDDNVKKWKPLDKSDFENEDSRQSIFNRGGDSRYGILFSAATDIAELKRVAKDADDIPFTRITPIGYQPFLRCPYQSGYIIEASDSYDMFQDISFTKIKFRHTEEFCQWIFNEMDEGRKIYPVEDMMTCEEVADKIKHSSVFTRKSFDVAFKFLNLDRNRQEEFITKLQANGYQLEEEVKWSSEHFIEKLNATWNAGDYEKELGINPVFRPGFCI
jgi:hypothetical protein